MPLRSTYPLDEWIAREQPSGAARLVVAEFLEALGLAPWAAPSRPILELSDQPRSELRAVRLPVPGEAQVHIWYRHHYLGDDIDLIAVTNR